MAGAKSGFSAEERAAMKERAKELKAATSKAEASPRSRAQCSWCQDVTLPNDVVLYSARRGGAAGRIGNTVGALVCANFECSSNVRKLPPMAYIGFDVDAAREKRITALQLHVATFALDLMG